ncbi:MAG: molybdenum cofactor guanylyltransferase [Thermodesulfobacteriota bacterium]
MIADTAGVLLAGGKSSRFGSNKALAALQDKPLISHAAELLDCLFEETLLVTNSPADYAFLGWPMTGDIFPGAGPLAGIHAALKKVASPQIFVVGCDMPLVQENLVRLLCTNAGEWDAVVPQLSNGLEPLCAVYRKTCLPIIDRNLEMGNRKLHALFDQVRTRKINEDALREVDAKLISFENINRSTDLEAISRLLHG